MLKHSSHHLFGISQCSISTGQSGDSGSVGQLRSTLVLGCACTPDRRVPWQQQCKYPRCGDYSLPLVYNQLTEFLNIYQLVPISWDSWVPTWHWGLYPGGHWASSHSLRSDVPLGKCSERWGGMKSNKHTPCPLSTYVHILETKQVNQDLALWKSVLTSLLLIKVTAWLPEKWPAKANNTSNWPVIFRLWRIWS